MPFDWIKYIDLADTLNNAEPLTEAHMRAALSRAYYGAFIPCRDKIGKENISKGIHNEVFWAYFNITTGNAKAIASNLDAMKKKRERADYVSEYDSQKEGFKLNKTQVEWHIQKAYMTVNDLLPKFKMPIQNSFDDDIELS